MGSQTAIFSLRAGAAVEAGSQTVTAVTVEASCQAEVAEAQEGGELTGVGAGQESTTPLKHQKLNPAQAKEVERAERAAARVMQLQAEVEAVAARYTSGAISAQETAPTAAEAKPAAVCVGDGRKAHVQRPVTEGGGGGGKQRRKAQLRRQAASAGMDVREWAASRVRHKLQLAGRLGGEEGLAQMDQRLEWMHEDWLARQQSWTRCGEEGQGNRYSVLDMAD
jgi:hypothetical protein